MKSKNIIQNKNRATGLPEITLLALPFLALTPNFFIIPDLTLAGLATQELVFSIAASFFSLIGVVQIIRSRANPFNLNKEYLMMIAAFALFIIWQTVSLIWAPSPYEGLRNIAIWLGFAIFFTAGLLALRNRSAIRLHYSVTIVTVVLAVSILYERAIYGTEMSGVFFNHGISSELIVLIMPLQVLNYLCSEKRIFSIISLITSALCFVALFVGMRRGAIIGATVTLIAIGLLLAFKLIRLQSVRRVVVALALLAITGTAIGVRFHEEIKERIQDAMQTEVDDSGLVTRMRSWITAWEMGKRHALFGVGIAGYPSLYGNYRRYFVSNPQYAKIAESAGPEDGDEIRSPLVHNEYLQTFVELGIVGLLLFVSIWAQVIWRLWRKRHGPENYWVIGAILGLVAFGISSAFSSFALRYTPGAFMLACVLGIGFAFSRKDSDPPPVLVPLQKNASVICVSITLLVCLLFAVRNNNVLNSQKVQGRSSLGIEPLDFAFYPNNPAGNERLQRRYEEVLDYDPHNAGAHLGFALLLFQMKKPAEAIPHAEFALKNSYSRPFTYVLLAFAHEQNKELSKASALLGDCVASFPQSIFARASYAEILRKEGKTNQMREQQDAIHRMNEYLSQSWELALQMKREPAVAEANRRGLKRPDWLKPKLAASLVGMRAYHYL